MDQGQNYNRGDCHNPSIFYFAFCFAEFTCPLPSSCLRLCDINFACSGVLCAMLKVKAPPASSPLYAIHPFACTPPCFLWPPGQWTCLSLPACCQPGSLCSMWTGRVRWGGDQGILNSFFSTTSLVVVWLRMGSAASRHCLSKLLLLVLLRPECVCSQDTLVSST